jgi:hypothetical protein
LCGRSLGRANRSNDRLWEELEATDGLYADALLVHERIVSKRRNLGFDRRKDPPTPRVWLPGKLDNRYYSRNSGVECPFKLSENSASAICNGRK